MKTKVNEIPLTGPRGRKELLSRIGELEKKVTELTNAGVTKSIVEMIDSVEDGTLEEALAALTIDGAPATVEKLLSLDISQFVIKRVMNYGQRELTQYFTPTYKDVGFIGNVCQDIQINGGFSNPANDGLILAEIRLELVDGESAVSVYEL